jgi:protein ImuB
MGRQAVNHPAELYACVYVREFPAQALLRLRPELKGNACVVMEGDPPFEEVCSLNTKARLLGIQYGMSRTDVEGFPQVKILSRSLKTESTVQDLLLECAGTYSPRLEDCSGGTYFLCAIDIAGTDYLFGPPEALARRLLQHVNSLGLSARIRVSSNFHTASCLAKASSGRSMGVVRQGEEAASLSLLPLDVLPLTEEQAEVFALWGIHSLGMLAALPDIELIARIGQDGRRLQQLARGELPHLFQPITPQLKLEERQELDFPLDSLDSLMFGIAVMLDQLILRAKTRLVALAAVTIALELDSSGTYTRRVRPARPCNDKQFWIRLLHLELQMHPPQAAVVAVMLQAEPGDTSKIQLGLFSPPLPEAARLDVTLAQLKTLLGEDNVGQAVLQDSHASESFRLTPFSVPLGPSTSVDAQLERTAVRKLRPPERTSVYLNHSRPTEFFFRGQSFAVEHAYGPWLIGGDWWNEMFRNIEHWDVVARALNDVVLCCCVTRDLLRDQWQVIALYD